MLVFHQDRSKDHAVKQYHINRFNAEICIQVPRNPLGYLTRQVSLNLRILQEDERGCRDRKQGQYNDDRYFNYSFNLCSFTDYNVKERKKV